MRNDHQTADHIFSIVANKLKQQKYNFAVFQIGGELHSLWTTAFRDLLDVERESILQEMQTFRSYSVSMDSSSKPPYFNILSADPAQTVLFDLRPKQLMNQMVGNVRRVGCKDVITICKRTLLIIITTGNSVIVDITLMTACHSIILCVVLYCNW